MSIQESLVLRNQVAADAAPPADPFAADWRVLLPAPAGGETFSLLLLLGGSPAVAKLLVEVGLTREVILDLSCERLIDAAVLLSGADVLPADIVHWMRPDAVLYWEMERPARSSLQRHMGRVNELLLNCGFSGVAAYRVLPGLRDCQRYVPFEARAAEPRSVRDGQPGWRFLIRVLRRLALRIPGTARNPEGFAVVAVRNEKQRNLVSLGILGRLAPRLLPSATRLLVVKRRGRKGRNRRLIVLACPSSDSRPVGALKVSRTPEHRSRIAAEQSALVSIRGLLDDEMKRSIPEPLGCFEVGGSLVGVESFLAGWRRARNFPERRRQFDLAVSWISEFHRQTEISRQPWGAAELGNLIEKPIAEYRYALGTRDREGRLFDALRALGRNLCGESLPLVWCHGDFNESNILFTETTVRVLDWETAAVGLPLFDLLFFATSWSYYTEGLKEPAARLLRFRQLVVEPRARDEISQLVWGAIEDYMVKVRISIRFVPLLLALHWIGRQSAEHVRILAEGHDWLFRGDAGLRPQ